MKIDHRFIIHLENCIFKLKLHSQMKVMSVLRVVSEGDNLLAKLFTTALDNPLKLYLTIITSKLHGQCCIGDKYAE